MSETFLGVIGMNLSTHNSFHLSSLFLQNAPINTLRLVFLYSLTIYLSRSSDIIRTQCSLLLRGVQIWAENGILSRLTAFLSVCLNSFISLTCALHYANLQIIAIARAKTGVYTSDLQSYNQINAKTGTQTLYQYLSPLVELMTRFELVTSSLPRMRSTD